MNRPLILASVLSFAVLAGVPTAALAQTFPASAAIVAGVHAFGSDRPVAMTPRRAAAEWRAPPAETAPLPTDRPQPLKLPPRIALEDHEVPQVDIRAKAEWTDDQGLRASPTKVSYKHRF